MLKRLAFAGLLASCAVPAAAQEAHGPFDEPPAARAPAVQELVPVSAEVRRQVEAKRQTRLVF